MKLGFAFFRVFGLFFSVFVYRLFYVGEARFFRV